MNSVVRLMVLKKFCNAEEMKSAGVKSVSKRNVNKGRPIGDSIKNLKSAIKYLKGEQK